MKPRTGSTSEGIALSKLFGISISAVIAVFAFVYWLNAPVPSKYQESIYDDVIGESFPNFVDEVEARNLYGKMFDAFPLSSTLSFSVEFSPILNDKGILKGVTYANVGSYRIWMKKPMQFRWEAVDRKGNVQTVFISNGDSIYVYWPQGRGRMPVDQNDEIYKSTRHNVFFKENFSMSKLQMWLGTLSSDHIRPILFPPMHFNGLRNPMQYAKAIRIVGEEKMNGELCDVIEVSFLFGQRSHLLWLSKIDHLPRKIKEVVRVCEYLTTYETWHDVHQNEDIPDRMFEWNPPADWTEIHIPSPSLPPLLQSGEDAPDFSLMSINGELIRLKSYRGSVVWLNFLHIGRPQCIEQLALLEEMHQKYKDKGLVILGFDWDDRTEFSREVMLRAGVTYQTISDESEITKMIARDRYAAVDFPTNYLLDANGKVAAAWRGYHKGDSRPLEALRKLGFD